MRNESLALPILLLLLTVLVPSAGVVWLMREAVRNERVATGQRLREAYDLQLQSAVEFVQRRWREGIQDRMGDTNQQQPAELFARLVAVEHVDSVIVCDAAGGVLYPARVGAQTEVLIENEASWQRARALEYSENRYADAAEAFGRIGQDANDSTQRALAVRSQARCLVKAGQTDLAVDLLQRLSADIQLLDDRGRSLALAADLRLLELLADDSPSLQDVVVRMTDRLNDYASVRMPSGQRQFLMQELNRVTGRDQHWPTLAAETLASDYLQQLDNRPAVEETRLLPAALNGIWQRVWPSGRVVELYTTDSVHQRLHGFCSCLQLPAGVNIAVLSPGEERDVLSMHSLGESLGEWKLALVATDGNPFDASSRHRSVVLVWIALLTVAATCVLAWLLSSMLNRRLRLAQLKNDLVATVSHELKTPLASIRLLVDTLLQQDNASDARQSPDSQASGQQTREYLALIAQQNERLTRLIDNFLMFSRIERGKLRFDFQTVPVQRWLTLATTVFCEHQDVAEDCLAIDMSEIDANICIYGDEDALITALVNLLENAWKYSGDEKHLELSATLDAGAVKVGVRDNGIGLSARDAARVFDRFYQVDQRVARERGGCGLGLSIVRAIVEGHSGSVSVDSRLNVGSTFTIEVPLQRTEGTSR